MVRLDVVQMGSSFDYKKLREFSICLFDFSRMMTEGKEYPPGMNTLWDSKAKEKGVMVCCNCDHCRANREIKRKIGRRRREEVKLRAKRRFEEEFGVQLTMEEIEIVVLPSPMPGIRPDLIFYKLPPKTVKKILRELNEKGDRRDGEDLLGGEARREKGDPLADDELANRLCHEADLMGIFEDEENEEGKNDDEGDDTRFAY